MVDELRRKSARNDYLITALQVAGLRDLRAPLDDVLCPVASVRMGDLARMGHRFQPFAFAPPDASAHAALVRKARALARIEVIARPDNLPGIVAAWQDTAAGAVYRLSPGDDPGALIAAIPERGAAVVYAHPVRRKLGDDDGR